jgi:hypothetical protein
MLGYNGKTRYRHAGRNIAAPEGAPVGRKITR